MRNEINQLSVWLTEQKIYNSNLQKEIERLNKQLGAAEKFIGYTQHGQFCDKESGGGCCDCGYEEASKNYEASKLPPSPEKGE